MIDGNGRVKLPIRMLKDFQSFEKKEVVVHCLPENALAVYPMDVWHQMRMEEPRPAVRAADSLAYRRRLRRFGAFTQMERLSNQGRLTIPVLFRDSLRLQPGSRAVIVGAEIGVEIWGERLWQEELAEIKEYESQRLQQEQ